MVTSLNYKKPSVNLSESEFYDFIVTLSSGERIFIKIDNSKSSNDIFDRAKLAEESMQVLRDTSFSEQAGCCVNFSIKNGLGILSYQDKKTEHIVELSGEYEIILCKILFAKPGKVIKESIVFNKYRKSRKEKGEDVYYTDKDEGPKLKAQVRSASERVNKKVKDYLELEQLIVYRAGWIQINELYLTD